MATLTFTYDGASPASLVAAGPAFDCVNPLDLWWVADSVGGNQPAGGVDGTSPVPFYGGELEATLQWEIRGMANLAGTLTSPTDRQVRRNMRDLQLWFAAAPGRQLTATVVDGPDTMSGLVQHSRWAVSDNAGHLIKAAQRIIVPAGYLVDQ